jgi:hypothetical protein
MSCASSGHITKLKQSIFSPLDIYGLIAQRNIGVNIPTQFGKLEPLLFTKCSLQYFQMV